MKYVKVKDLNELKSKASNGYIEVFILLKFGLRSSKQIYYNEETNIWHIYNYIDDFEDDYTEEELNEDTNIVKALNLNALYYYK